MLEALVKLINYLDHIVERQLGFPLRDRTWFPNSKARVIYPLIVLGRKRKPESGGSTNHEGEPVTGGQPTTPCAGFQ
jgi:hypothetical protein